MFLEIEFSKEMLSTLAMKNVIAWFKNKYENVFLEQTGNNLNQEWTGAKTELNIYYILTHIKQRMKENTHIYTHTQ